MKFRAWMWKESRSTRKIRNPLDVFIVTSRSKASFSSLISCQYRDDILLSILNIFQNVRIKKLYSYLWSNYIPWWQGFFFFVTILLVLQFDKYICEFNRCEWVPKIFSFQFKSRWDWNRKMKIFGEHYRKYLRICPPETWWSSIE